VSFVRTPDGQLIAATTGTSSAYYLTDNLGSTVGIVTSSGMKTAAYAYDPYGRTRTATGPNATANAIRYAGGLFDATTGVTKFGARYYDPNTGRFTQPDPSGQGQNPYAYAGNNPITWKDPGGLCGEWYSVEDCDPFNDPSVGEIWGGAVTGAAEGGAAGLIIGCGVGAALEGVGCVPVAGIYATVGGLWGAAAGALVVAWGDE